MDEAGYVNVAEILNLRDFKSVSLDDIIHIHNENNKHRFEMSNRLSNRNGWFIRAVQGHSIDKVQDTLLLKELPNSASVGN
mmetsp:Transcript_4536/g.9250  ORF Transcript_4536/g.9250 Transcript_4536/m.9250 type:complete len:81 (+) Transcript_4536:153-395(+)